MEYKPEIYPVEHFMTQKIITSPPVFINGLMMPFCGRHERVLREESRPMATKRAYWSRFRKYMKPEEINEAEYLLGISKSSVALPLTQPSRPPLPPSAASLFQPSLFQPSRPPLPPSAASLFQPTVAALPLIQPSAPPLPSSTSLDLSPISSIDPIPTPVKVGRHSVTQVFILVFHCINDVPHIILVHNKKSKKYHMFGGKIYDTDSDMISNAASRILFNQSRGLIKVKSEVFDSHGYSDNLIKIIESNVIICIQLLNSINLYSWIDADTSIADDPEIDNIKMFNFAEIDNNKMFNFANINIDVDGAEIDNLASLYLNYLINK